MAEYFNASQGAIWVQPDGPNTQPYYLGCHDMGDITAPEGDITKRYCPDPSGAGKWTVAMTSQGLPGDVTASITTYVANVQDYLQQLRCPTGIYIHQAECGRKDVFSNYDAGTLLRNARITSRSKTGMAAREGADASEMSFDLSADPPLAEYWALRMSLLTTTGDADAKSIAIGGEEFCSGACGATEEPCDELGVGLAASTTTLTADVLYTADAGATWAAMATDPFAAGEDVGSIVAVQYGRGVTRYIAARGTTDGANPAEVAYTDNLGAAWTAANVGATNGEFVQWGRGLFAIDLYNIWMGTDQGNIYYSSDGGANWALQTTAGDAINAINFLDSELGLAVGDTNEIQLTTNGGTSWTSITGDATKNADNVLCCDVRDRYRWQIGYNDGELWYTIDGGATWAQRTLPAPAGATAVNAINAMDYIDDYFGALAVKYTVSGPAVWGAIYRTVNGGYSWEIYTTLAAYDTGAVGMADVVMCNENDIYGVGDLSNALTTLYRASL